MFVNLETIATTVTELSRRKDMEAERVKLCVFEIGSVIMKSVRQLITWVTEIQNTLKAAEMCGRHLQSKLCVTCSALWYSTAVKGNVSELHR